MLFGTHVAKALVASAHMRAQRQVGHVDAGDLIKALQTTLWEVGCPYVDSGRLSCVRVA